MRRHNLPEAIEKRVGARPCTLDHVGMSGSEIWIYDDVVLKIQPQGEEAEHEHAMAKWIGDRVPVPDMLAYCVQDGMAYTLMSRAEGEMLCATAYLDQPEKLIDLAAQGLKRLWEVDVRDCPYRASRLDERLRVAAYNVSHHLVDTDNVDPETFGANGFADPEALLRWLGENRPDEDIVLTHGDYCLPNIFAKGDAISGFIDLGKMGPADRWQDIALAIRSLRDNFGGRYTDGKKRFDFQPQMLMDALGVAFDPRKYGYYILLDELF